MNQVPQSVIEALHEAVGREYENRCGRRYRGGVTVKGSRRMDVKEYKRLTNPIGQAAVLIGVDAGTHTGIAVGSREDPRLGITFCTMDFWSAYDFITAYDPAITGVVVEVPSGHVVHAQKDHETRGFARDKFAANVGSARREAVLLADRFERLGFPVLRVAPRKAKWTAEQCRQKTGITARTNEHVRDAIRLVWERL